MHWKMSRSIVVLGDIFYIEDGLSNIKTFKAFHWRWLLFAEKLFLRIVILSSWNWAMRLMDRAQTRTSTAFYNTNCAGPYHILRYIFSKSYNLKKNEKSQRLAFIFSTPDKVAISLAQSILLYSKL